MEIWKPAFGFEGFYEVSNQGNVRSVLRTVNNSRGRRTIQPRILKTTKHAFGYPLVHLSVHNRKRRVTVHRLMYQSFHGPLPDHMQVRHLNSDPTDCRLENLAAGTSADNHQDMIDAGRSNVGAKHHNAKLNKWQVRLARKLPDGTLSLVAAIWGVSQPTLSKIRCGQAWSHIA